MRDFHDVEVLRGVTHVVAPRDPTQLLQLSETELPLDKGVGEILAAQVDGGLHDVQAKAARFVDRGDDRPCGAFGRLLGQSPRLVDVSQQLAQRLYDVAAKDQRVTDGTLAVLLCQAVTMTNGMVRFPVILKLDPSPTLDTVTDKDPKTGKRRVRYAVNTKSLPSKNEKIQKCAFVREINDTAEYEMLLVDRQRRGEAVARFWIDDFLGGELALDTPERTKRLYRVLLQARNAVEQDLTAEQVDGLTQVIEGAVVQSSVNLDTLIAGLPVPDEIRTRIDASVSTSLPDREFDLDQEIAAKFVRRRSFRADNDLRISVKGEAADMIHVEDLEPGDDDTRLRKVWFETRTWHAT